MAATKAWRRWARWLGGAAAGLLGLTGVILIAATCRPGWYNPPAVAPDDYRQIRNELPSFGSAIGSCLQQGRPFRIELTDEKLNRWLAARGEIWPALKRSLPPEIQDPVIAFQPGRIVLGARYDRSGVSSVISLATTLELDQTGTAILIRLGRFRAGLVPVPQMLVEPVARRALADAIRSNWSKVARYTQVGQYNLADELHIGPDQVIGYLEKRDLTEARVPSHWIWPNGRFPFYVSNLQVEEGRLLIDIVPTSRPVALSIKADAAR